MNNDKTYFTKKELIDIDTALNKIVYLEVNNPLKYGLKTCTYYGRIVKITKEYFEIIEYCNHDLGYWYTKQIQKHEENHLAKKWKKTSIQKLYEVETNQS